MHYKALPLKEEGATPPCQPLGAIMRSAQAKWRRYNFNNAVVDNVVTFKNKFGAAWVSVCGSLLTLRIVACTQGGD